MTFAFAYDVDQQVAVKIDDRRGLIHGLWTVVNNDELVNKDAALHQTKDSIRRCMLESYINGATTRIWAQPHKVFPLVGSMHGD